MSRFHSRRSICQKASPSATTNTGSEIRVGHSSGRRRIMITEKVAPMRAAKIENTRYIVPMSLWLVLYSQRLMPVGVWWSSWA